MQILKINLENIFLMNLTVRFSASVQDFIAQVIQCVKLCSEKILDPDQIVDTNE